MNQPPDPDRSLVFSYLALRKAIGIIGIALPFVLAFGKILFDGPGIQGSVSSYYYTVMRDVFVGSLCAIGVFLMSYRGYEAVDQIAGLFAGISVLAVALFPTTPEASATSLETWVGAAHLFFAACFLLTLAFFSLVLFRKTDPTKTPTPRKLQRNAVYTVSGYAILACLALIVVVRLMSSESPVYRFHPVFWLESAAIVAFGVSWLTKGEAILKDAEA